MSVSDPVADMLTKVRNAAMARHEKVDIPASKLKLEIVKILKTEGYIKNFKRVNQDGLNCIRVFLKYDDANKSVIHGLERVSKPGLRTYAGVENMPKVMNGMGIAVISTNKGIMTDRQAKAANVGGEVLCYVY